MNTADCPPGLFSDEILVFPSEFTKCDSPIVGYLVLAGVPAVGRIILAVLAHHLRLKLSKEIENKLGNRAQPRSHRKRQLDFAASISVGLFQCLFVILTALNVASMRNYLSPFLAAVFFLPTSIQHAFQAHSVLSLGRKLIPLSAKAFQIKEDLNRFDPLLKFSAGFSLLSIIMFLILFTLGTFVGGDPKWTFQAGFSFVGLYQFFGTFTVCWQLQRCIRSVLALRSGFRSAQNLGDHRVGAQSPEDITRRDRQMIHAVRRMMVQQAAVFIAGSTGLVVSLSIAADVILLHWYIFCVAFLITDFLFQSAVLASIHVKRRRDVVTLSKQTTSSNQNQQFVEHESPLALVVEKEATVHVDLGHDESHVELTNSLG